MAGEFFTFKNKPLVKNGGTIYYGNMFDKYVVMMKVIDTKIIGDITLTNNVLVQLMQTSKDVKPQDIVVKKAEKVGIASAMEIADIWLSRALLEN